MISVKTEHFEDKEAEWDKISIYIYTDINA